MKVLMSAVVPLACAFALCIACPAFPDVVAGDDPKATSASDDRAKWSITGDTLFRADVGEWDDLSGGSLNGGLSVIQPSIGFESRYVRVIATPQLKTSSGDEASVALPELSCAFADDSPVSLRIGRFSHGSGLAYILRNGDFLVGPVTPAQLIDGESVSKWSDNLVSVRYETKRFAFSATCAPFTPERSVVSGDSALFPRKDIRDPYEYSLLFPISESLSRVSWARCEDANRFALDPSFLFESEYESSRLLCRVKAFFGKDRTRANVSKVVSLLLTDPGYYRIAFDSVTSNIIGIGFDGELKGDESRAWIDAAYVDGRLLPVGTPYDRSGAWQSCQETDSLALTTGIATTFAHGHIEALAEWRTAYYFSDADELNFTFLHRALYGRLSSSFMGGKAGISTDCAYSLSDASMLISPGFRYSIAKGHDVKLECVVPLGDTTSELGQFSATQSFFVRLSFSVR